MKRDNNDTRQQWNETIMKRDNNETRQQGNEKTKNGTMKRV